MANNPFFLSDAGRFASNSRVRHGHIQRNVVYEEESGASMFTGLPDNDTEDIIKDLGSKLEAVGVRRLRLEHTFVQLSENSMQNAVMAYRTALNLPRKMKSRETMVLQSAAAINQLRFGLGSMAHELCRCFLGASSAVAEGRQWQLLSPEASLTPLQAMLAIHTGWGPSVVRFTTGLLAGRAFSVAQIQAMMTDEAWLFAQPIFFAYVTIAVEAGEKMLQLPDIDALDPQTLHLITNLISQHWALQHIWTFTKYTHVESRQVYQKRLPSEFSGFCMSAAKWAKLMGWIKVSRLQLGEFRAARQVAREALHDIETADVCLHDILTDTWSVPSGPESDFILESVEAARKNNMAFERMSAEAALRLMFGILTPSQTACLIVLIRAESEELLAHWEDWMLLFYGGVMNGWMDSFQPSC